MARGMTTYNLLLLPGDGIGPEVMGEVERIVGWINAQGLATINTETDLVGGCAYDAHGEAISDATMKKALAADAVMLGAVGGPKWDGVPYDQRPEAGLLRLRKDLELFANLRPAICYPALADASSLKRELVEGLDIMIVRELTGGVYFGEPKTITDLGNGQKRAVDTQVYETYEIERIAAVAFELARKRKNLVHSAEKRNVMKTGVLWNEVVTRLHKERYCRRAAPAHPRRQLRHAARARAEAVRRDRHRQSVRRRPVGRGGHGHRLSRHAAVCLARRGGRQWAAPLRSMSRCMARRPTSPARAWPIRSPRSRASPCACVIPSILPKTADKIERAISSVLDQGLRTGDIKQDGCRTVGTREMGDAILKALVK